MSAEALEGPGEAGLHGHADGAAGRDDAQQNAGAVGALGAAGEEHIEAQLGDVLKLALGGGVVDGDVGVVDEAEEGLAVALVVADGGRRTRSTITVG